MEDEITAHVVVEDSGLSGHGHLTVLGLTWHRRDPLAVELTLSAQPDHPSLPRGSWAVLRDFLRYGLEEPTGDGAVRIGPDGLAADGSRRVRVELLGQAKPYAVHVSSSVVREFLDETEAICPTGAEADDSVMDALIARLLEY
jgi:hypothetical protein